MSGYRMGMEKALEMARLGKGLEPALKAYLSEPHAPEFLKGMEEAFADRALFPAASLVAEAGGDENGARIYRNVAEIKYLE